RDETEPALARHRAAGGAAAFVRAGQLMLASDGELNLRLREGLAKGPRVREVQELPSERDAIDRALADLQPGDLLVLGVEAIEASVNYVQARVGERGASAP